MTIQVYKHEKNAVVTRSDRDFTADQIDLIKRTICQGATDDELAMFIAQCKRTGLDPFARQIYSLKLGGRRQTMVAIDGFRLIAERTGKYAGQLGPWWCGEDGVWKDVWLGAKPPMAARIGVLRSDFKEPLYSVALFSAYVQQGPQWQKNGPHMVAKCCEALGLRRAFPQELSGLYAPEEMDQANEQPAKPVVATTRQSSPPAPSKSLQALAAEIEIEVSRTDRKKHAVVAAALEVFPEAREVQTFDDGTPLPEEPGIGDEIIRALDEANTQASLAKFYATYKDAVNALGKEARDFVMKQYREKKTIIERKG